MKAGKLFAGTSGWVYSDWGKGLFYPKGLAQNQWLSFYAQRFSTVEINSTYYRYPKPEFVKAWHDKTPRSFTFALKANRQITHYQRLVDCRDPLKNFLALARKLQKKLGPILFQLPPTSQLDIPLLESFLHDLKTVSGKNPPRYAFEFRHPSWLKHRVAQILAVQNIALALADMPKCPIVSPNQADFVYIRRHGPTGRYQGKYSRSHLRADAQQIKCWLSAGRDVYIYYNNDIHGHALTNACDLLKLVDDLFEF